MILETKIRNKHLTENCSGEREREILYKRFPIIRERILQDLQDKQTLSGLYSGGKRNKYNQTNRIFQHNFNLYLKV